MLTNIYQKTDANHYVYSSINNPIYNGPILWTKVHVGWQAILDYDWGNNKRYQIPETDDMRWTDVLDTKALIMDL